MVEAHRLALEQVLDQQPQEPQPDREPEQVPEEPQRQPPLPPRQPRDQMELGQVLDQAQTLDPKLLLDLALFLLL